MKPQHVSHSQVNSWLRCGKQYYLERIASYKAIPSVYLVTGNAVHSAIEQISRDAIARGLISTVSMQHTNKEDGAHD